MKKIMENWRKHLEEKVFADYSDGEKGKWIDLTPSDLAADADNVDITDELYDMIQKSYAAIGGNVDIRTAADIPSDYDKWVAVDVDADPEPDAVRAGKTKAAGVKMTLGASDGSPDGKDAYLAKTAELLHTPGYFGEMSDAAAHMMIKYHNAPFVGNAEDVQKVLGKDIEWVGAHPSGKYPNHTGWYLRRLGKGSKPHMKILLGMPNGVDIIEPVNESKMKISKEELKEIILEEIHNALCEERYEQHVIQEAEYKGKKVKLNDPIRTPGESKKFKVYVKNDKGNVVVVRFGDPDMEIKRDDPERRKSFRKRHNCANKKDITTPGYWSCWQWRAGAKVDN